MGMFDYIRYKGDTYQTKDTPTQWMTNYEIREDGTLWEECFTETWVENKEALLGIEVTQTDVHWKFCDTFDGVIVFYREDKDNGGHKADRWIEYKSLFMDGKIVRITLCGDETTGETKMELDNTKPTISGDGMTSLEFFDMIKLEWCNDESQWKPFCSDIRTFARKYHNELTDNAAKILSSHVETENQQSQEYTESIELNLPDKELLALFKLAHEKDQTFNEFVVNVVEEFCEKELAKLNK